MTKFSKVTEGIKLPVVVLFKIFLNKFQTLYEEANFYSSLNDFFYKMFEMVIQYYFYLKQQQNPQFEEVADVEDLIIDFIIQLKKYKSKEKRNSYLEDNFLNGLINVIYAILFYNPEFIEQSAIEHGLINEVFNNCLF